MSVALRGGVLHVPGCCCFRQLPLWHGRMGSRRGHWGGACAWYRIGSQITAMAYVLQ